MTRFIESVDWKRVEREAIPLAAGGAAFIVATTVLPFGAGVALNWSTRARSRYVLPSLNIYIQVGLNDNTSM